MDLLGLNHQCLLHLFSFLDKDSRKSLSLTCAALRDVYLDPRLWRLLRFSSLSQLRRDNFVLGPSLRHLSICWYSSRVLQVCNVEDWSKSSFQRDICARHHTLVADFLASVHRTCPNLLTLKLSGCGHLTDQDVLLLLDQCGRLRQLHLENCVRITDRVLDAVASGGGAGLEELRVDFCRNVTAEGLGSVREKRPRLKMGAVRSATMIPDRKPEERAPPLARTLRKLLNVS
ncbi:LOW QUALITY PROTEIN: F-box and leucine-rich protein 22 [Stigmatopora nigra]